MYSRLYRTVDRFHKPEILEAAKAGLYSIQAHLVESDLVRFSVRQRNEYLKSQRAPVFLC